MGEEQIITILIVFALCLNVLGFVFFVLSLKGEKEIVPIQTKYDKDYDLPMNDTYLEQDETPYQFKKIEDEYEETYRPTYPSIADEIEERFQHEPNAPLKPAKEIEPIQEKIYTPEPEDTFEEENPYQYQAGSTYKPRYEEESEPAEEVSGHQFQYEPRYMTEDELDDAATDEKTVESTPIRPAELELDLTKEVDYQDEVQPTNEHVLENEPTFDGDYQFKHAYSKEERYKYEYDDYKGYAPQAENDKAEEAEDEFDYTIDIDQEHEKYYGSTEFAGKNRYELYLEKRKEKEEDTDDLLAKVGKNRPSEASGVRQMFRPVDLEHVPEMPLDREEREAEELIDIKQFEPKKYENQQLFAPVEEKPADEFDDEEVERRIEYLMGKMHDPLQGKKKKDLLEEEF